MTVNELDLREVPAAERAGRALAQLDSLPENGSFVAITAEDPRPIFDALRKERTDVLAWIPLLHGPQEFRVEIMRLKPKESEEEIGAYFARDHDEIDALFSYVRADLEAKVKNPALDIPSLAERFEEFNARLERHMRWEEEILFAVVEEKTPALTDGPGRVMRIEHDEIRKFKGIAGKLLRERRTAKTLARAAEALDHALHILIDHNRKEEHVYYPMADQMFTRKDAADILARCRAMR